MPNILSTIGITAAGKTVLAAVVSCHHTRYGQSGESQYVRLIHSLNLLRPVAAKPNVGTNAVTPNPAASPVAAGNTNQSGILSDQTALVVAKPHQIVVSQPSDAAEPPKLTGEEINRLRQQISYLGYAYQSLNGELFTNSMGKPKPCFVPGSLAAIELHYRLIRTDENGRQTELEVDSMDFKGAWGNIAEIQDEQEAMKKVAEVLNFFSNSDVIMYLFAPANIPQLLGSEYKNYKEINNFLYVMDSIKKSGQSLANKNFALTISQADLIPGFQAHVNNVRRHHLKWSLEAGREAYQLFQGKDIVLGLPYQVLQQRLVKNYFDPHHSYYNPDWGQSVQIILRELQPVILHLRQYSLNLDVCFVSAVGDVQKEVVTDELTNEKKLETSPAYPLNPKGVYPLFYQAACWMEEKNRVTGYRSKVLKAAMAAALLLVLSALSLGLLLWPMLQYQEQREELANDIRSVAERLQILEQSKPPAIYSYLFPKYTAHWREIALQAWTQLAISSTEGKATFLSSYQELEQREKKLQELCKESPNKSLAQRQQELLLYKGVLVLQVRGQKLAYEFLQTEASPDATSSIDVLDQIKLSDLKEKSDYLTALGFYATHYQQCQEKFKGEMFQNLAAQHQKFFQNYGEAGKKLLTQVTVQSQEYREGTYFTCVANFLSSLYQLEGMLLQSHKKWDFGHIARLEEHVYRLEGDALLAELGKRWHEPEYQNLLTAMAKWQNVRLAQHQLPTTWGDTVQSKSQKLPLLAAWCQALRDRLLAELAIHFRQVKPEEFVVEANKLVFYQNFCATLQMDAKPLVRLIFTEFIKRWQAEIGNNSLTQYNLYRGHVERLRTQFPEDCGPWQSQWEELAKKHSVMHITKEIEDYVRRMEAIRESITYGALSCHNLQNLRTALANDQENLTALQARYQAVSKELEAAWNKIVQQLLEEHQKLWAPKITELRDDSIFTQSLLVVQNLQEVVSKLTSGAEPNTLTPQVAELLRTYPRQRRIIEHINDILTDIGVQRLMAKFRQEIEATWNGLDTKWNKLDSSQRLDQMAATFWSTLEQTLLIYPTDDILRLAGQDRALKTVTTTKQRTAEEVAAYCHEQYSKFWRRWIEQYVPSVRTDVSWPEFVKLLRRAGDDGNACLGASIPAELKQRCDKRSAFIEQVRAPSTPNETRQADTDYAGFLLNLALVEISVDNNEAVDKLRTSLNDLGNRVKPSWTSIEIHRHLRQMTAIYYLLHQETTIEGKWDNLQQPSEVAQRLSALRPDNFALFATPQDAAFQLKESLLFLHDNWPKLAQYKNDITAKLNEIAENGYETDIDSQRGQLKSYVEAFENCHSQLLQQIAQVESLVLPQEQRIKVVQFWRAVLSRKSQEFAQWKADNYSCTFTINLTMYQVSHEISHTDHWTVRVHHEAGFWFWHREWDTDEPRSRGPYNPPVVIRLDSSTHNTGEESSVAVGLDSRFTWKLEPGSKAAPQVSFTCDKVPANNHSFYIRNIWRLIKQSEFTVSKQPSSNINYYFRAYVSR